MIITMVIYRIWSDMCFGHCGIGVLYRMRILAWYNFNTAKRNKPVSIFNGARCAFIHYPIQPILPFLKRKLPHWQPKAYLHVNGAPAEGNGL